MSEVAAGASALAGIMGYKGNMAAVKAHRWRIQRCTC